MKTELTLTRNSVIFMACGVSLTYEWLMRKTTGIPPANTLHNETLFRKKMEKIFIALTTVELCLSPFCLVFYKFGQESLF